MLLLDDLFLYILSLSLEISAFQYFLPTYDVAKVAQLPLSYCVSKGEWGANLLQHPVVGS